MNRKILILILGTLPAIALAGGDHGNDHHDSGGHGMEEMTHGSDHPDMASMSESMHGDAGRPGDPAEVSRTIDVAMDDSFRFTPDQIEVHAGETVRFFVRNKGRVAHEMVIGSMAELKEHAEMMRSGRTYSRALPSCSRAMLS